MFAMEKQGVGNRHCEMLGICWFQRLRGLREIDKIGEGFLRIFMGILWNDEFELGVY